MGNILRKKNKYQVNSFTKKKKIKKKRAYFAVREDMDIINHFMPPCIPIVGIVDERNQQLSKDLWAYIKDPKSDYKEDGSGVTLLTYFLDYFYESLYQRQASFYHRWTMEMKSRILYSIMELITKIKPNDPVTDKKIYAIAKRHNLLNIRPALYSIFIDNLIITLGHVTRGIFGPEYVEAFCNLTSYMLTRFLPVAIKGLINPHEAIHQRFHCGLEIDQIEEVEKRQKFRQEMRKAATSSHRSSLKSGDSNEGNIDMKEDDRYIQFDKNK